MRLCALRAAAAAAARPRARALASRAVAMTDTDPPSKTAAKREQRAWRAAADAASALTPAQLASLALPTDAVDALALAATIPRRNQARKRQIGLASKLLAAGVDGDAASFAAAVAGAAQGKAGGGVTEHEWLAVAWRDALLSEGGDADAERAAFSAAAGAAADGLDQAPDPGALRALVRAADAEKKQREAEDAAAAAAVAAAVDALAPAPPPPRRRKKGGTAQAALLRALRPLVAWHVKKEEGGEGGEGGGEGGG